MVYPDSDWNIPAYALERGAMQAPRGESRTLADQLGDIMGQVRREFRDRDIAAETLRCKLAETQLVNRRLADELARRGATEAEITAVIQEATR